MLPLNNETAYKTIIQTGKRMHWYQNARFQIQVQLAPLSRSLLQFTSGSQQYAKSLKVANVLTKITNISTFFKYSNFYVSYRVKFQLELHPKIQSQLRNDK